MTGNYTKRKIKKFFKYISNKLLEVRKFLTKRLVKNQDFTVISNNCWGGWVYRFLDLPYLTPTVGLFFVAEDYLKFIIDLNHYLSLELKFINAKDSRHYEFLKSNKQENCIIGVLDDVEIVFLHYISEEEAREKWNRRKQRVNYNHIIFKFSNMRLCTEEHLSKFDSLPFENKFMLNINKKTKYKCEIYWRGEKNEHEITNDTIPFPGPIKLVKILNAKPVSYPKDSGLKNK